MAWFSGKVSLGNFPDLAGGFPDLAGAVNKLQESVKNIEKNFDTALGFEEKSESSNNEGQKSEDIAVGSSEQLESSDIPSKVEEKEEAETDSSVHSHVKATVEEDKQAVKLEHNEHSEAVERADSATLDLDKVESLSEAVSAEPSDSTFTNVDSSDSPENEHQKEISDVVPSADSDSKEAKLDIAKVSEPVSVESSDAVDMYETNDEGKAQTEEILKKGSHVISEESSVSQDDAGNGLDEPIPSSSHSIMFEETNNAQKLLLPSESVFLENDENTERVEVDRQINDRETDAKGELHLSSATAVSGFADSNHELEKVKMEMNMMESALLGAARQAQAKADEIAKLMNENEQLKAVIEDLKISCLRAEQTQLSRSLEKERQRAAEHRQEYLAAKEEADTQEGRANQLVEEIRELRRKHKQELQDSLVHQERLQQEVERERAARLDLERTVRMHSTAIPEQAPIARHNSALENGSLSRKLSNASSLGSMEESYFLQASLDSSDGFSEKRNIGEATLSPLYMKSMTPNVFESTLRQKEGELASYMSRLASMESIRDSLAEELVKLTEQCEKLKAEAATLPGIQAELEALRRRHSAALELMGERDEELEELRADIVDLKEMYREQVNMLVNKIQIMSSSSG